jgi:putative transposase
LTPGKIEKDLPSNIKMKEGIFMPRKPRQFVAGGIYHVFNRGNNRRTLFEEKKDYECFMAILDEGKIREGIQIFHYCLMANHYHFLVRSETAEALPRYMHWIQLGYARYFKKCHDTTGHVFEERYRSPRIAAESYYLQCGRYIERNPVKAKLVLNAEDYPYSSAAYYVKGQEDPLVSENLYYRDMGQSPQERRSSYQKFVRIDEPYFELINDQLLKY